MGQMTGAGPDRQSWTRDPAGAPARLRGHDVKDAIDVMGYLVGDTLGGTGEYPVPERLTIPKPPSTRSVCPLIP